MKFGVPMIWREQKDYSNDCYFCQQDYMGCTAAKKKKHIVYPNLQSALRPVKHSKELPVSKAPNQEMWSSSSLDKHCSVETRVAESEDYDPTPTPEISKIPTPTLEFNFDYDSDSLLWAKYLA